MRHVTGFGCLLIVGCEGQRKTHAKGIPEFSPRSGDTGSLMNHLPGLTTRL
jgi:hypothetical protein